MAKNKDIIKPRVGRILPGQRWVELNGMFTVNELRMITQTVEEQYKKAVNGGT